MVKVDLNICQLLVDGKLVRKSVIQLCITEVAFVKRNVITYDHLLTYIDIEMCETQIRIGVLSVQIFVVYSTFPFFSRQNG